MIKKQTENKTKGKGKRPSLPTHLDRASIERTTRVAFEENPSQILTYKQICHLLGKTTMAQKRLVYTVLVGLSEIGYLEEVEPGRFIHLGKSSGQEGRFEWRSGRATFVPDTPDALAIPIPERNCGQALHGDRVRVSLGHPRRGKPAPTRVEAVLERCPSTYVGTIQLSRGYAFFVSEHRELRQDLYIPQGKLQGAKDGDKVVARVVGWEAKDKNPVGEVTDILGRTGENNAEMHAILAEFGLPYAYPAEVEAAAEQLDGTITPEELAQREDFRQVLTFTIDPKDAKDFDDALSLRQVDKQTYEVGVHIADVSHFVQPADIIDQEAYARATSIYLVDRTIPMLPERLSNFLCSLRPDEDKYAYSCIFTLDAEAQILKARIMRTVIRSRHRFTYEEAQQIIETGEGPHAEAVLLLNRLAQKLRERRFEAGSIGFERQEVRFELDADGKPIAVHLRESLEAHQLIEEFMLLANRTVAERMADPKRKDISPALRVRDAQSPTFVYRIHEVPDIEKLTSLSDFVGRWGYKVATRDGQKQISQSLNKLLKSVRGRSEEHIISTLAIRSMAKARYTTEPEGHYGLSFEHYTHFTSPIRRYPDLMVHRLLTQYLVQGSTNGVSAQEYEQKCKHASDMENLATSAERSSIKYKQVEYMLPHLGQTYAGVISGVTEWGLYVELDENKCEGLVPVRELDDDYYEYDDKNYALVGRSRGRRFALGDKLEVVVARVDLPRKQLDFSLQVRAPRSKHRR